MEGLRKRRIIPAILANRLAPARSGDGAAAASINYMGGFIIIHHPPGFIARASVRVKPVRARASSYPAALTRHRVAGCSMHRVAWMCPEEQMQLQGPDDNLGRTYGAILDFSLRGGGVGVVEGF